MGGAQKKNLGLKKSWWVRGFSDQGRVGPPWENEFQGPSQTKQTQICGPTREPAPERHAFILLLQCRCSLNDTPPPPFIWADVYVCGAQEEGGHLVLLVQSSGALPL